MWKAAKPGEPSWASPWGPGRPGWHIECSAMARTYLGSEFDIHGGGLDLIFPHHENEAAQSHGVGDGFARYWMHSHWVTMAGEKMSKSLGNILSVPAITENIRPMALRYYLISVHYRSSIEYSQEALDDAAKAFERIEAFLHRVADRVPGDEPGVPIGDIPDAFRQAMDDDLGVPRALAVVHEKVRAGNAALAARDHAAAAEIASAVRAMLAVLGLDPWGAPWATGGDDRRLVEATGHADQALLAERAKARADRDFARADEIRIQLAAAGFAIEDTKDGPVWSVARRIQGGGSNGRQFPAPRRDAQAGHQEGRRRRERRAVAARGWRARARRRPPRCARVIRRPGEGCSCRQAGCRSPAPAHPAGRPGRGGAARDGGRPQPGGRGAAGRGAGDRAVRRRRARLRRAGRRGHRPRRPSAASRSWRSPGPSWTG